MSFHYSLNYDVRSLFLQLYLSSLYAPGGPREWWSPDCCKLTQQYQEDYYQACNGLSSHRGWRYVLITPRVMPFFVTRSFPSRSPESTPVGVNLGCPAALQSFRKEFWVYEVLFFFLFSLAPVSSRQLRTTANQREPFLLGAPWAKTQINPRNPRFWRWFEGFHHAIRENTVRPNLPLSGDVFKMGR